GAARTGCAPHKQHPGRCILRRLRYRRLCVQMSPVVSPQAETDLASQRMRIRTLRRCLNRLVQSRFGRFKQAALYQEVGKPDPAIGVFGMQFGEGPELQECELPVVQTELHRCELAARLSVAWLQPKRGAKLSPCLVKLAG